MNKPRRVVMIEDEKFLWQPLADLLQAKGYEVLWFTNASEAYWWFSQASSRDISTVELILLDLMLPAAPLGQKPAFDVGEDHRRSGVALIKQLHSEGITKKIPVIGFTVVTDPEIRKEADEICLRVYDKTESVDSLLEEISHAEDIRDILREVGDEEEEEE